MELKDKIRTIPHFPKKGIMFKDITTLLKDPHAFRYVIREMMHHFDGKNINIVASAESRGFILGAVLAHELHAGFVPLRKPGKLPYKTIKQEFETEYSIDAFEIHEDAIDGNSHILLVDDLIATGGTALAACQLIEKLGGKIVECCFIVDLPDLGGKKKILDAGYKVFNLVEFEGE